MSRRTAFRATILLAVLAAVFVVGNTGYWALRGAHALPYWDSWEFVVDLQSAESGDYGLSRLFAPANEHRIAFPRLLFFADAWWFGLSERALVWCGLAMMLALAGLVAFAANAGTNASRAVRIASTALLVGIVGSGIQIHCLGWSFAPQFMASTLFPALACVLVAASAGCASRGLAFGVTALAVLAGLCATFSVAGCLLVWPVLLALAVWQRLRPMSIAMIVIGAATSWGVYFRDGFAGASIERGGVLDAIGWGLTHLGSACGVGEWGIGFSILGLALLAIHARTVLGARENSGPLERALLAILVFELLVSMAMGVGRSALGTGEALASRYAPGPLLWWAALCALQFRRMARGQPGRGVQRIAWIVPAALVVLLLPHNHRKGRNFQNVREGRELATLSILLDEVDSERCLGAYPWPGMLPPRVAFLRRRELSVFAGGLSRLPGRRLIELCGMRARVAIEPSVGSRTKSARSRLELVTGLLPGSALDHGESLAIVDGDGVVRGLGSLGWRMSRKQRAVEPPDRTRWFALLPAEPSAGAMRWFVVDPYRMQATEIAAP